MLTDSLALAPSFVSDITGATAASDPNVSLYLIPTSADLGLTIFTGGGNVTPTLTFNVAALPEPATASLMGILGASALLRRRRRV